MIWLVLACSASPEPVEAPAAGPTPEELALQQADALASEAAAKLKTRMIQEMGAHGPGEAFEACSMEAEALTASVVPEASGARVGRSSLRLRNPANQAPPWVQAWLDATGEAAFADATGIRDVQDTPAGKVARVLRPIPMQETCLACHGHDDTLPADVRATLSRRYPDDAARGYAVGELRGALWAEIQVLN